MAHSKAPTNFALTVVGGFDESAGEADTHFHRATRPRTTTRAMGRSSQAGIRGAVGPATTCLACLFRAFFVLLLNGPSITAIQNMRPDPIRRIVKQLDDALTSVASVCATLVVLQRTK